MIRLVDEPGFLQSLIRTRLLQNNHRCTVHTVPDSEMATRRAAAEEAALVARLTSLTPEDVEKLRADNAALLVRQATPDPPEMLARIPSLKASHTASLLSLTHTHFSFSRLSLAAPAPPEAVAPEAPAARAAVRAGIRAAVGDGFPLSIPFFGPCLFSPPNRSPCR